MPPRIRLAIGVLKRFALLPVVLSNHATSVVGHQLETGCPCVCRHSTECNPED
ncbi:hypothetical protein A3768_4278 (plasmid) [Ralstonia solanacearum]|nr:hypothetical protein A3768_4278 [Ralstonia solanacearum]